jgi:hypothetical protein
MMDHKIWPGLTFLASNDMLIQVLIWENTRYLSNFAPAWKGRDKNLSQYLTRYSPSVSYYLFTKHLSRKAFVVAYTTEQPIFLLPYFHNLDLK